MRATENERRSRIEKVERLRGYALAIRNSTSVFESADSPPAPPSSVMTGTPQRPASESARLI